MEWGSHCSHWPALSSLGSIAIPNLPCPALFPFSFAVDSRGWVGNDLNEGPGSLGQWPGILNVGEASAVTQPRPAQGRHLLGAGCVSWRRPSCALRGPGGHLSLPVRTELGVWMTCRQVGCAKEHISTFGLPAPPPRPKTGKETEK